MTTLGFPEEPATGRGRSHGTSGTEPFDRWFRYPAGFASDYATLLLRELDLRPGSLLVDPFAGSAVTGTAARTAQMSFLGIEAHPLIAELGQLKMQHPPGESAHLGEVAADLAKAAADLSDCRQVSIATETELVKRCFEEHTLQDLVSIRELVLSNQESNWHTYLKWALLATLRDVASAPVGWPYQRPGKKRKPKHKNALVRFLQRVEWMASDIQAVIDDRFGNFHRTVASGDSRDPRTWNDSGFPLAEGCLSSPPYLNNFDYADATRLELFFWGEARTWSDMCMNVRSDMITATTQQSSVNEAQESLTHLSARTSVAERVAEFADLLTNERKSRSRGKEYDRVVPAYFLAMFQVLENLANTMAPGAPVVFLVGDSAPYGVYIDTPSVIADLAQAVGFSAEKDVVLRRRGQRWAKNTTRHDVSLTERLLMLRRNTSFRSD